MANVSLDRIGQIKGTGAVDALFLKLGIAELLSAFDRTCVFKGKVKERNIKGGKSAAFPVSGKADAAYHVPGTPILGATNSPGDRNEQLINLDGLMIADQVIYDLEELMNYYDVRQDVTHQLGQALAREWDKRAARVLYAAAKTTTEPLAKAGNAGRIGNAQTLSAGYAAATANAGDTSYGEGADAREPHAAEESLELPHEQSHASLAGEAVDNGWGMYAKHLAQSTSTDATPLVVEIPLDPNSCQSWQACYAVASFKTNEDGSFCSVVVSADDSPACAASFAMFWLCLSCR